MAAVAGGDLPERSVPDPGRAGGGVRPAQPDRHVQRLGADPHGADGRLRAPPRAGPDDPQPGRAPQAPVHDGRARLRVLDALPGLVRDRPSRPRRLRPHRVRGADLADRGARGGRHEHRLRARDRAPRGLRAALRRDRDAGHGRADGDPEHPPRDRPHGPVRLKRPERHHRDLDSGDPAGRPPRAGGGADDSRDALRGGGRLLGDAASEDTLPPHPPQHVRAAHGAGDVRLRGGR